jgi:hypothetical protein
MPWVMFVLHGTLSGYQPMGPDMVVRAACSGARRR